MKAEIAAIGASAAFLDAVAEQDGRGAGYVTAPLRERYEQVSGQFQAQAEAAAGAVLGFVLAQKLQGVALDANEPLSDASLAGALSQILGVPVASVKDRAALKDALRRAVSLKVSEQVGSPFEDVFDRDKLKRDALRAAGAQAGQVVPGLVLNDLSSRQQTIDDVIEYSRLMISDFTGINFQNLHSKQQIKEDIYFWAMPQLREKLELENGQGVQGKPPLKMDKKSIRRREAVRRFRLKWGNRKHYKSVRENNG